VWRDFATLLFAFIETRQNIPANFGLDNGLWITI
jgi:hypothetical protein